MDKINLPKKIFVTGTDTEIGKTVVSSILVKGMNASYWKIIQTGEDSDKSFVKKVTKMPDENFIQEAYKLKLPLSPYAAATYENIFIDINKIKEIFDLVKDPCLVAEGAGGVMVPVTKDFFMSDLISVLGLSAVVVARSGLGTINHTLLTIEHLKSKNIDVACIVLNGEINQSNNDIIEEFSGIKTVSLDYTELNDPLKIDEKYNSFFT
ncbi:MAG: dethiobiotin synthase [Thermodesulfobacteriota bacterium]